MAAPYEVEYYEDERGRTPVSEWLKGLRKSNPKAAAKALYLYKLLEQHGEGLRLPMAANVSGPVWELRGKAGTDPVRLYYFRKAKKVYVIVCGELKKRDAADPKLIRLALKAHEEIVGRAKRRE